MSESNVRSPFLKGSLNEDDSKNKSGRHFGPNFGLPVKVGLIAFLGCGDSFETF